MSFTSFSCTTKTVSLFWFPAAIGKRANHSEFPGRTKTGKDYSLSRLSVLTVRSSWTCRSLSSATNYFLLSLSIPRATALKSPRGDPPTHKTTQIALA